MPPAEQTPGYMQVLQAVGTGGTIGGFASTLFIGWWGVLVALTLFVGSALLAGMISAIRDELARRR